ncbi:MAG: hypothetical protein AAFY56_11200 [Pseudomonadota bacterium]
MERHTRIRINLSQREFEIEGSEDFVRGYQSRIDAFFEAIDATRPSPPPDTPGETVPAAQSDLGAFGEYIQRLPSSATDVDRMLAAGYFVQRESADDAFATAEANRRLAEYGIKIGNPSQCVKQSLMAKRLFMVQRNRYRVSQFGRVYLRQILSIEISD